MAIERAGRPERVAAHLPLAAAFWGYGLGPFGFYGTGLRPDGTSEVYAGNLDLEAIASVGENSGEIDLEKLVALEPDRIANDMWTDAIDV